RYDHSVLTFDYVALNYVNSSENEYAHMLEGFENEWNYVKSNRSATYTNLNPGKYTFRVKAANNDDIWNEAGVSIDIIVTPPIWKTAIFKIMVLLMIIFIVFLIVLFFIKREKLKNQLVLERVKSKELRKMDMMKFQFFTNISHEIRTPISLILSPLTRIINSDLSKQQIKRDLDVVYRNATRLGKLIDQLLDYRKIEAGKLKLELSKGDIVSFLKKVIYLFKELSTDKRVNLEFYTVLDQIQIFFDPDKIEKVLFNLLSNAFKHTPEGGTIRVAVSLTYQMDQDHTENGNVSTGEYVQIVVKDTGRGIPENKREKIFERFYQDKSSGDQVNTGSGIGLSLSRELVKIHNGSISLRSQEGIGTEFTILLPALKEDPDRKKMNDIQDRNEFAEEMSATVDGPIDDSLVDNGKPILLVLEDNRELLEFIVSIFEEDYQVIFAEDGAEGLRLANETIPDIVISDILMPKIDG
ncbi:MAG: response regulator, partial [Bacteroidales bacterium]|nr:response regulator [Bacteroidales bacterium]